MNSNAKWMPMLVMRGVVVFPNTVMHLDVSRAASLQAVSASVEQDRRIFLVAQKDIAVEEPEPHDVYRVGTVAVIKQVVKVPNDDGVRVVVEGLYRATLSSVLSSEPCYEVGVEECPARVLHVNENRRLALLRSIKEEFVEFAQQAAKISPAVMMQIQGEDNVGRLCDKIAFELNIHWEEKQQILEQVSLLKRADMILSLLKREAEILQYEKEIQDKVQQNVADNQRDYYLREQLRVLNDELYGYDDIDELQEYRSAIEKLPADDSVKEKLYKEVDKLSKMPQGAHEATVVYHYLDTLLELPWNTYTTDSVDLKKARRLLDEEHFGLEKVKQRILEMLAVRLLAPEQNGQILCLVGPPGVGKTSIAASVAACMGRKYARVSLGGVKDESEIRGHRRTYIGAMPGRIIDAIKTSGSSNPLLLLDEIDKIGNDYKGDCSASLLEVLDPEQNRTFQDHYVDMPYDLSKVLFITTANDASAIPSALLDRMEVLEISSYTREEKFHIAKNHLIKKQMKKHGLTGKTFRMADAAIFELIDFYTREGGVRQLEREIASICRKAACKLVEGDEKVSVKAKDIQNLLGVRKYKEESLSAETDEVGLVNGLAWTSVGGEVMRLEAAALPGTGKVELTGSLGDVMQESARTAIGYVRSQADSLGIPTDFYKTTDIHIHATEAAVPKDGPSAGVTMAVAIVSALTNRPIHHDVAMTGEISLRGRVLPIGGLKEKTMAAYKAGVHTVLIPKDNAPDLEELDPVVKKNLDFVICDTMDTVFRTALREVGR